MSLDVNDLEDTDEDDEIGVPSLCVPAVIDWLGVATDMPEGYSNEDILDHVNEFATVLRNRLNRELLSRMEETIREVMTHDGTKEKIL